MVDTNTESGEVEKTVSEKEYQKLQRTVTRRDKQLKETREDAGTLSASVRRLEALVENVLNVLPGGDEGIKTVTDKILTDNNSRRTLDESSAQLTARLTQTIDAADDDWDDPKFDSARRVLDEINSSGDLSKGYEVERLIKEALDGDENDIDARIAAAEEAAVLRDRQEYNRVDTSQSQVASGSKYSRKQIEDIDWSQLDPAAVEEHKAAIYKQLGVN